MFDIITNRKLIFISTIIVVIALLGLIFSSSPKEKPATIQIVKESSSYWDIKQHQSIFDTFSNNEQFDEPKIFKKSDPLFEDIMSKLNFDTRQQASEISPISQPLSEVSIVSIEQQVFEILYPDYFTSGLSYTQQFYIEQEFLSKDYEKIEDFDSEEKIFAFVNTSIDVFEEQSIYSKEEAEKFRNGVNKIWKGLLAEEKIYWQRKLIGSDFYNKILANRQYHIRKSASEKIAKIFETIKNTAAPYAYAADCYRGGATTPGGANVWAPCCNCGLNCNKHGCFPVDDCGSGCDIDLGCKNLFGKGKPVIWDSSSGICGVG